ncbi:hypothetical protein DXG01_005645 [Tephrocybe rancida]|nr:hypothetical protein DXG01_005645 [Tephrocybe rancida]
MLTFAGRIIGYVRQPKTEVIQHLPAAPASFLTLKPALPPNTTIPPGLPALPAPPAPITAAHAGTLYTQNEFGHFVPVIQTANAPTECNTKAATIKLQLADEWDGWPDGDFECDFTHKEFEATNELVTQWATATGGGSHTKDTDGLRWQEGKTSTRKCLGIIKCNNKDCEVLVCPHTKKKGLCLQLTKGCLCGAVLVHHDCNVQSRLWTWKGGVHYSNSGYHAHERPSHVLHLMPKERYDFKRLVASHPNAGPLELVVGVRGIHGPSESSADISDVLLNRD